MAFLCAGDCASSLSSIRVKPRIALFVKSCDGGLFTQNRDEQEIVKGIGIGFLSCIGIGIAKRISQVLVLVLVLLRQQPKYWYWYWYC